MKTIVLCADDYGQAPAISDGILALVAEKRLSAVSCMVNTQYWPEYAKQLAAYKDSIDMGLHFNLTHGQPLSTEFKKRHGDFCSLPTLLRQTYTMRISRKEVAAELNAQIDAFQQATGMLPRFLDGHQHIHHLPHIRDVVINIFNDRLKAAGSYIRLVNMCLSASDIFSKKIIIYLTGVRRFRKLLDLHEIRYNHSFSGIYNFKNAPQYAVLFRDFLQEIDPNGLIMCHPGKQGSLATDEIAEARFYEYKYLISDQFLQDCIASKVALEKFQ